MSDATYIHMQGRQTGTANISRRGRDSALTQITCMPVEPGWLVPAFLRQLTETTALVQHKLCHDAHLGFG